MLHMRSVSWLICFLVIAGCQSLEQTGTIQSELATPQYERILIATTRARSEGADDIFSGDRGSAVDHAFVEVSVPPVHERGKLERPRYGDANPSLHFSISESGYIDSDREFLKAVNEDLERRSGNNRDILLFVHGYNNEFNDSVFRYAQFVHDSEFEGARILFTWASRGSALDYFYDRESATIARDGLERTLELLANSKARNIHIMAHSMGNWVAMESLRQLQFNGDATLGGKIGEVVLASPDIDVDVFKSQMLRVGKPNKPYNLLVSRDDRALGISQRLSGNLPRLGNYAEDGDIANLGIIVYDVTGVKSDDNLRHGKFASAPEIVQLLGSRLSEGDKLAEDKVRFSERLQLLGENIVGVAAATGDIVIHAPETVLTRPDEILTAPVEVLQDAMNRSP